MKQTHLKTFSLTIPSIVSRQLSKINERNNLKSCEQCAATNDKKSLPDRKNSSGFVLDYGRLSKFVPTV